MNQEFFEDLLNKYIAGNLSPEEKASLGKLIQQPEYEHILEGFVKEIMLSDEFSEIDSPKIKTGILDYLEGAIKAERAIAGDPSGAVPLRKSRVVSFMRYAAAILLFLLIGGGYFAWQAYKENRQLAKTKMVTQEVAPGKNAAVLTLAGGQKIVLDSSATGAISKQGNTTIVNTNGQLAYNAMNEKPTEILYNTLTTQRGNRYQLVLPDGSKVWLNAASSITFPTLFVKGERKVTITGEAYFEVTTDKNKPFKVDIRGKGEVEVLGTHFNINAYDDEPAINTTLLEGSVKVNALESGHLASILLKPGQQVQLSKENQLSKSDNVDLDGVVAWKNGLFNFSNKNLHEVMRQLARWYNIDVVYENGVRDIVFEGEMTRNENLGFVLKTLQNFGVHFRMEDGKRLVVVP